MKVKVEGILTIDEEETVLEFIKECKKDKTLEATECGLLRIEITEEGEYAVYRKIGYIK